MNRPLRVDYNSVNYETYKILHLIGVLLLFIAFGGMLFHAMSGGGKKYPQKKLLAITHGVGLTVILVAGFGLLARLDLTSAPWPGWVFAKLLIWLVAGGMMAIIPRKPRWARALWFVIPALGALAAGLAVFKPF